MRSDEIVRGCCVRLQIIVIGFAAIMVSLTASEALGEPRWSLLRGEVTAVRADTNQLVISMIDEDTGRAVEQQLLLTEDSVIEGLEDPSELSVGTEVWVDVFTRDDGMSVVGFVTLVRESLPEGLVLSPSS